MTENKITHYHIEKEENVFDFKRIVFSALVVGTLAIPSVSDASDDQYAFRASNGDLIEFHKAIFGDKWTSKVSDFYDFMSTLRTINPSLYERVKYISGYDGLSGNFSNFDLDNDGYATLSEISSGLKNSDIDQRVESVVKILEREIQRGDGSGGRTSLTGGSSSSGSSGSGGSPTGGGI